MKIKILKIIYNLLNNISDISEKFCYWTDKIACNIYGKYLSGK